MKKFAILIAMVLVLSMIFCTVVMAQESSSSDKGTRKAGAIAIKAGVTIMPDKDFDSYTLGSNPQPIVRNWPGRNGFTIEGSVTAYSTDYVDIDGAIGVVFNAEQTVTQVEPGYFGKLGYGKITNVYYLGGLNIYPTKKDFFFGFHAGGVTSYYGDYTYTDSTTGTVTLSGGDSETNFMLRVGGGIDTKHIIVQASYIMIHQSEALSDSLIGSLYVPSLNRHGFQILGGYKF
ncbi:MAG: hypothetical protein ABRQ39_01370 [Candidatus Eremiobacterota bacterium]